MKPLSPAMIEALRLMVDRFLWFPSCKFSDECLSGIERGTIKALLRREILTRSRYVLAEDDTQSVFLWGVTKTGFRTICHLAVEHGWIR